MVRAVRPRHLVLAVVSCLALVASMGAAGAGTDPQPGNGVGDAGGGPVAAPSEVSAPEAPGSSGDVRASLLPAGVPGLVVVPSNTGAANGTVDVVTKVTRPPAARTATLTDLKASCGLHGSAVAPDGQSALVVGRCDADRTVEVIRDPGTTSATPGTPIDISAFIAEGGPTFDVFGSGVALSGDGQVGLVAIDSRGVVVLKRNADGTYAVDTSVQSAGTREDGQPHPPGFLRSASANMTLTDGVVISPAPLADGSFLGVGHGSTQDSSTVAVQVYTGLGKAPTAGTVLTDVRLRSGDDGNGGMAFSPTDPTRVVVVTTDGFAVLFLDNPAAPVLGVSTPLPGGGAGSSITVMPDGDHVVVSDGDRAFVYTGLRSATSTTALVAKDAPVDFGAATVQGLAALPTNDVAVALDQGATTTLGLVRGVLSPATYSAADDVALSTASIGLNSLSAFPGADGYRMVARDGGSSASARPSSSGPPGRSR
ncbi:MAG: hypothetical protein M5U14_14410 [Acidimicrobiia bacterium]|nr:hypothetical protein [Acidimicrobiia bacterium]